MIRASIDLGTNTCLLLITEWNEEKKQIERVISDYATVVRLGEGVDRNRELQLAPMERTFQCLLGYAQKVRNAGGQPEATVCVATSQARDAKNSQEFFKKIQEKTGFGFRVLSGEEEARLTFFGALLPDMSMDTSAVIDIGGGSTEFISLNSMKELDAKSIDLGSVRFTERFFKKDSSEPVQDEEFWKCQDAIDTAVQELIPWRNQFTSKVSLVAVAGTATTLAAWFLGLEKFDASQVDGLLLSRGDIHRMVEELKWRSVEERKKLPGMEPLRADVLLAGALILWRSMELLKFSECRISTRGLRFGVLSLAAS